MVDISQYEGMTEEEQTLAITGIEHAVLVEMGSKFYEDTSETRRELQANPPAGDDLLGIISWCELLLERSSTDLTRENLIFATHVGDANRAMWRSSFDEFLEAKFAAEALGITMHETIRGELTRRRNRAGQSFAEEIESRGVSIDEAIRQGFSGKDRFYGSSSRPTFTLEDDDTPEGNAATASRSGADSVYTRYLWRDAVRRSVDGARRFAKKNAN